MEQQVTELDEVLASVLPLRPVGFASLVVPSAPSRFEPGALAVGNPPPDWTDFIPPDPKGLARIFGGNARHAREVAEAKARFDAAMKAHAKAEADRQRAFTNAKVAYDLQVVADQKRIAEVRARQSAFMAGDPEAVEWFVDRVLDASSYPRGFPRRYQVAYRPENRDVVVEFELPPQQVVPVIRGYRYVQSTRRDRSAAATSERDEAALQAADRLRCAADTP